MALVKSYSVNKQLSAWLREQRTHSKYWIGLNDKNVEGVFRWQDGSHMQYEAFYVTYGINHEYIHPNRDCVAMDYQQEWYDFECSSEGLRDNQRLFICESNLDPNKTGSTPTTTHPCLRSDLPASKDAVYLKGKCYYFVKDLLYGYQDAKKHCEKHADSLALVKSLKLGSYLTQTMARLGIRGQKLWIGANDIKKEKEFRWEDGTLVGIYNNFRVGQGSYDSYAHPSRDCVAMADTGLWYDLRCSPEYEKLGFICEYKKPDPSQQMTTMKPSTDL